MSNRVRIAEEGDSAFVAGELVWREDFEREVDSITKDNARYTEEAVAFFSGKKLRNLLGGNVGDLVNRYRGVELSEAVIEEILSPGYVVSSVIVNDGEEDLRKIGRAHV